MNQDYCHPNILLWRNYYHIEFQYILNLFFLLQVCKYQYYQNYQDELVNLYYCDLDSNHHLEIFLKVVNNIYHLQIHSPHYFFFLQNHLPMLVYYQNHKLLNYYLFESLKYRKLKLKKNIKYIKIMFIFEKFNTKKNYFFTSSFFNKLVIVDLII